MVNVPISIEDFKELITKKYYYIDKTKFIEEIVNSGSEAYLFTRPRRFGKSLNLSMFKYFFDIENAEENKKLFSGLYIEKSDTFSEQGKYPVIHISMKGIASSNFNDFINAINYLIAEQYSNIYDNLKNISETAKSLCVKYNNQQVNIEESKRGLYQLSKILHDYYNQKVIILIDEYDAPLIHAYTEGYYEEAVEFLTVFYGNALKSNVYLKKGIMAGILTVDLTGIYSGLNNLDIYTILNRKYDEYFGFTESEVIKALNDFNLEYKIDDVRSWYKGYTFGNKEIYNPWSILKFIQLEDFKEYWINVSTNDLIRDLFYKIESSDLLDLNSLINGEKAVVPIEENVNLNGDISKNNLWEILLYSGYITIDKQINNYKYEVRIPNKEIQTFFKGLFIDRIFENKKNSINFEKALKKKDIDEVIKILNNVVLYAMSYYETSQRYEISYQLLMSGFMYVLSSEYNLELNKETGVGRADIVLNPINKNYPGYIFELKRATTNDLKKEAKKAFEQIEANRYDSSLKQDEIKDIVKIGLVFDGKIVESYYEKNNN